jgi:anti-sigma B factor antagonist
MLIELDQQNDICVLRFKGRFVTEADRTYLNGKVTEIKATNSAKVLADFRDVPYIDSTGIGFIVSIFTSVTKDANGRFVVVGSNKRVREVFDLTRLSTVIPLAPDMAAGIAVLSFEGSASVTAGKS